MTLASGQRLGTYEILSPLGAGGMGEVYRARDTKLDRDVAIKVLPESVASDPDSLARFEREAKAVAALSHPNILAIHDFGRHDGIAYAVMELLRGKTLRGSLDFAPLSQKQAVDYALQITRGLSAAHERGIVHRDLKPENVFVTKEGHVKILDFGLAKRVDSVAPGRAARAATASEHTEPGTVMGTVGYMSPEQVKGQPVDHRSDIFSFGTMLYEMLSGQRAFKRDTSAETIVAILTQDPPEFTGSGRNVSPALDRVVRHCLEKDPGSRFQSAKDVGFALSEASGAATFTSPSGVQAVATGRKKWLAAAAVLVVAAAVGLFLLRRPQADPGVAAGVQRVAVLPFENLGSAEDDYFSDGMADAVRGKLTSVPGLEVIARGSSTPYRKTNKTPQEIAKELGVHYLLTATVRWQKGRGKDRVQVSPELVEVRASGAPASKWQEPFDAAITDVFQVQADIATKVAQALGSALGTRERNELSEKPTQNLAAYEAFLRGEAISNALAAIDPPTLRKGLGFYEQAVALDPGFAEAWARVSIASSLLYTNGVPTPALAERARETGAKALALAPSRPDGYLAGGAYERMVRRNFSAAREQLEKGLRVAPGDARLLRGAALVDQALARPEEAMARLKQALSVDPRSVGVLAGLGDAQFRLGRHREAREYYERALAIAPASLNLIEKRAMTFLGEGDLAGARRVLAAAPSEVEPTALLAYVATSMDLGWVLDDEQRKILLRLTPSAFDDDRAVWAFCLVQAYALEGDTTNARIYAEEARKAIEDQLRDAPGDAQRRSFLGLALAYDGRKEEAIREGERSVALAPISKDAENGPYYQHQLVRIYMLVGEQEKALDALEPLLRIPYLLSPGWLAIDPNFDPLRQNPRFQKLVGKT